MKKLLVTLGIITLIGCANPTETAIDAADSLHTDSTLVDSVKVDSVKVDTLK